MPFVFTFWRPPLKSIPVTNDLVRLVGKSYVPFFSISHVLTFFTPQPSDSQDFQISPDSNSLHTSRGQTDNRTCLEIPLSFISSNPTNNLLDNVPRIFFQHYPRYFGEIRTYLGSLRLTYWSISLALGAWLPNISSACVTPRPYF